MASKNTNCPVESKNTLNAYQEKTQKILHNIGQLFQPFKDVIVNITPSAKWLVRLLDFIGGVASKAVLLVLALLPYALAFVKGRALKFLLAFVFVLILMNTLATRLLSTNTYKQLLAEAITNATGYKTVIEGRVDVNFLFLTLKLNDAGFYSPVNKDSNLALNLFSVNHLKLSFAFWPLLFGHLKAKSVSIDRAHLRYKLISSQEETLSKFTTLSNDINTDLANAGSNAASGMLANSSEVADTTYDSSKKYLNLKDLFNKSQPQNSLHFVNSTNHGLAYPLFTLLVRNIEVEVAALNRVDLTHVFFEVLNGTGGVAFTVGDFTGSLNRAFGGSHTLVGHGRFFGRQMQVDFKDQRSSKGQHFSFTAQDLDAPSTRTSIAINGAIANQGKGTEPLSPVYTGTLKVSGAELAALLPNLWNSGATTTYKIDSKTSALSSTYTYDAKVLMLNDLQLRLNNTLHNGSVAYDFSREGSLEVSLNLNVPNLDPLIKTLDSYKALKSGTDFSILSDLLLEWENSKRAQFSPRYLAFNLSADHTTISGKQLPCVKLSFFLDDNDNMYVSDYQMKGSNFQVDLKGKISLAAKTGVMIARSNGSIASVSSYLVSGGGLSSLLATFGGDQDQYDLSTKMLLSRSGFVLSNITGKVGNKVIKDASATVATGAKSDIIINTQLSDISADDFYNMYNVNRQVGRTYFSDETSLLGLSKDSTVEVNLHSDKMEWRGHTYPNLDLQASIIGSGILVHKFSFNDTLGVGTASGSFNFNTDVTPAIVGNIDFTDFVIDTSKMQSYLLPHYSVAGKVVLNGTLNMLGNNYYDGIGGLSGQIHIINYERFKLHRTTEAPGFYLTLVKMPPKSPHDYQLGDIYGSISINNNLVDFTPAIVRYVGGARSYRGTFAGRVDILHNLLDVTGKLSDEKSPSKHKSFHLLSQVTK